MFKAVKFRDLKKIRNMSLNDFNRWVESIYQGGMNDSIEKGGWISDEEIYIILRSEKIGSERARKIVNKIIEGMEPDEAYRGGKQEQGNHQGNEAGGDR